MFSILYTHGVVSDRTHLNVVVKNVKPMNLCVVLREYSGNWGNFARFTCRQKKKSWYVELVFTVCEYLSHLLNRIAFHVSTYIWMKTDVATFLVHSGSSPMRANGNAAFFLSYIAGHRIFHAILETKFLYLKFKTEWSVF